MNENEKTTLLNEIKDLKSAIRQKEKLLKESSIKKECYILGAYITLNPEKVEFLYQTGFLSYVKLKRSKKLYKTDDIAFSLEEYFEKSIERQQKIVEQDNDRLRVNTNMLNCLIDKLKEIKGTMSY